MRDIVSRALEDAYGNSLLATEPASAWIGSFPPLESDPMHYCEGPRQTGAIAHQLDLGAEPAPNKAER